MLKNTIKSGCNSRLPRACSKQVCNTSKPTCTVTHRLLNHSHVVTRSLNHCSPCSPSNSRGRNGVDCRAVEDEQEQRGGSTMWTDESGELTPMGEAAYALKLFVDGMPELSEDVMAPMLNTHTDMVQLPLAEVRAKLVAISEALEVNLAVASRLITSVPQLWTTPPASVASRLRPVAQQLGVTLEVVVYLVASQPLVYAIAGTPSLVKDRFVALAERLAVSLPVAIELVCRQKLLWMVGAASVASNIKQVQSCLGLTEQEALELACRMPVVLTLEPRLLALDVAGTAATTGLTVPRLLDLLTQSLGLVAVPSSVLSAALYYVATTLDVDMESVLQLAIQQPTLLCAQVGNVRSSIEVLRDGLNLSNNGIALRMLCAQPALLYDFTRESCGGRLDGIAKVFEIPADEVLELAAIQPALLTLGPSLLRSGVTAVSEQAGASLEDCLSLLLDDPTTFASFLHKETVIDSWAERLDVDEDLVRQLLQQQPGLLEATANSVKARLESLAALFEIPSGIAVQLIMKHPALAAVPPNATITRAKNLSSMLNMSMKSAAELMAKEPTILLLAAGDAGQLRPFAQPIYEINSIYEFYTTQWVQGAVTESQPSLQRNSSFSSIDSR